MLLWIRYQHQPTDLFNDHVNVVQLFGLFNGGKDIDWVIPKDSDSFLAGLFLNILLLKYVSLKVADI